MLLLLCCCCCCLLLLLLLLLAAAAAAACCCCCTQHLLSRGSHSVSPPFHAWPAISIVFSLQKQRPSSRPQSRSPDLCQFQNMGDDTTRRTLYVGNLPDDITTKELNDEFRRFGRIVRYACHSNCEPVYGCKP